jgi:hypothetical protein
MTKNRSGEAIYRGRQSITRYLEPSKYHKGITNIPERHRDMTFGDTPMMALTRGVVNVSDE